MSVKRAVKYCGGCNCRYDRSEKRRQIEETINEKLSGVDTDKHYDEVYVLCGCSAKCADVSAIKADRFIYIDSMESKI